MFLPLSFGWLVGLLGGLHNILTDILKKLVGDGSCGHTIDLLVQIRVEDWIKGLLF